VRSIEYVLRSPTSLESETMMDPEKTDLAAEPKLATKA
jgi:hypothetical protein